MIKIEPHIDFFAFLIILGVIQGMILSYFFLNKKNRVFQPNIFVGLLMLSFSLISFDIFLCYTGYMANFAFLDNFSESLSFAISPLFYLYAYSHVKKKVRAGQILHFIPFFFYAAYNLLYMSQSTGFKLQEYIHAYFPDIALEQVYPRFNTDPLHFRNYLSEIIVLYLLIYLIKTMIIIINAFLKDKASIFLRHYKNLSWLRNFTMSLFIVLLVLVTVKLKFGPDIGDYLISSCLSLIIYGTSLNVIRSSMFFKEHVSTPSPISKKYAKSSLSEEDKSEILEKLKTSMLKEKYYRNNLISESQLSRKLLIPTHHISQVINEKLKQSFFEFIALYRIKEAEQILSDPGKNHLTIDEVAEEVGYISKSAFNKSFKKITGKTPSEYRS